MVLGLDSILSYIKMLLLPIHLFLDFVNHFVLHVSFVYSLYVGLIL